MMKLLCKTCRERIANKNWYWWPAWTLVFLCERGDSRERSRHRVRCSQKTCCCKLIEFYIFVWLEIYNRRQWLCPSSRFFARSSHALGVVVFFNWCHHSSTSSSCAKYFSLFQQQLLEIFAAWIEIILVKLKSYIFWQLCFTTFSVFGADLSLFIKPFTRYWV